MRLLFKKKSKRDLILTIAMTIGILFGLVIDAASGLHSSVKKYKNIEVDTTQIKKLQQYDHLIRYFCGFSYYIPKHRVSPDFVRALILAESGADHRAVSPKDALGLGQILYTTGREAAQELANSKTSFKYVSKRTLKELQKNDLFDPAVNILLTCFLIAKYNYKFNGRLELVLSAWNAGENTKSLQNMEHAPYLETEDLIGKVNGYFVYLLQNRIFR